jgi:hypothetical protein
MRGEPQIYIYLKMKLSGRSLLAAIHQSLLGVNGRVYASLSRAQGTNKRRNHSKLIFWSLGAAWLALAAKSPTCSHKTVLHPSRNRQRNSFNLLKSKPILALMPSSGCGILQISSCPETCQNARGSLCTWLV